MDVKELKSGEKVQIILTKSGLACIEHISNKVITTFNNILASNGACLKTGNIDGKFKERMITNWEGDIDQIWSERQLNNQMLKLNEAKLNARQSAVENAWRPHGQSVARQTQSQRITAMNNYIRNFEEILEDQTSSLQALIMEVDGKRNFLNELSKRRQNVSRQIEVEIVELEEALEKCTPSDINKE